MHIFRVSVLAPRWRSCIWLFCYFWLTDYEGFFLTSIVIRGSDPPSSSFFFFLCGGGESPSPCWHILPSISTAGTVSVRLCLFEDDERMLALLSFDWYSTKRILSIVKPQWTYMSINIMNLITSTFNSANSNQKFSLLISDSNSADGNVRLLAWRLADPVRAVEADSSFVIDSSGSVQLKNSINRLFSSSHWSLLTVSSSSSNEFDSNSDFIIATSHSTSVFSFLFEIKRSKLTTVT